MVTKGIDQIENPTELIQNANKSIQHLEYDIVDATMNQNFLDILYNHNPTIK